MPYWVSRMVRSLYQVRPGKAMLALVQVLQLLLSGRVERPSEPRAFEGFKLRNSNIQRYLTLDNISRTAKPLYQWNRTKWINFAEVAKLNTQRECKQMLRRANDKGYSIGKKSNVIKGIQISVHMNGSWWSRKREIIKNLMLGVPYWYFRLLTLFLDRKGKSCISGPLVRKCKSCRSSELSIWNKKIRKYFFLGNTKPMLNIQSFLE